METKEYKLFIESFMQYMSEEDKDEEVFPSELASGIYDLAKSIGCEEFVSDIKEGVMSKAVKALVVLSLIALSERTPYKATKFMDKSREVLVNYVINPINDKVLDPIFNTAEALKDASESMIKDAKKLPDKTVEIFTKYSKDAEGKIQGLTELSAKVGVDMVKFNVNELSDNMKTALMKDANKKDNSEE